MAVLGNLMMFLRKTEIVLLTNRTECRKRFKVHYFWCKMWNPCKLKLTLVSERG
jgi:hypothetical protein